MKRHLAAALWFTGLAARQDAPLNDSRLDYPYPQHGLTEGPDGWYVTRQTGPWGTGAQQGIWRLSRGVDELERPAWSDPAHSESDFYFSAGLALGCFLSNRPLPDAPARDDPNIWCVNWRDSAWSAPKPLPSPVNTQEREWSPVVTKDGAVYFASDRPGGLGLGDIYKAESDGQDWRVDALSDALNSEGGEWTLDLSPDGNRLVFEASHRATNRTVPGDLYVSTWSSGQWSSARPLSSLNTDGSDLMPRFIGPRRLVFTTVQEGQARFRIVRID